ncbi:MAG: transcriptional repressor [Bacteroidota bacterium]|nr:transcriptional repressor [Bacteroidota bacterium]
MTLTEKTLLRLGIRPTVIRVKMYQYLKRRQSAVSLVEMEKTFAQKGVNKKTVHKTTFYRTINLFMEQGLVHQIDDGTYIAKYALSDRSHIDKHDKDLHMHFHCTVCGKTLCLPDRISEKSLPDDYEVSNANLVLKGVCKSCRKNNKDEVASAVDQGN